MVLTHDLARLQDARRGGTRVPVERYGSRGSEAVDDGRPEGAAYHRGGRRGEQTAGDSVSDPEAGHGVGVSMMRPRSVADGPEWSSRATGKCPEQEMSIKSRYRPGATTAPSSKVVSMENQSETTVPDGSSIRA